MQRASRAALIAAGAAALVTIPGLGSGTLWDNSETAYGEVAREILLTHDWIVMHLNAAPWYVQPPLYFWIAALFAKIFGVTSFALRLPSALATIVMGGLTAYAVTRQAGFRAGIYAGIVLSTSLMQAIVGRLAIMDALLDLAVAFSIFWWFRALQTGLGRYFVYGCAAAALGFLAKGPVAPVIALLVTGGYYAWERTKNPVALPNRRSVLGGIAVFVAILLPWFAALVATAGLHAPSRLIVHFSVGRYTGTIENQSGPVWYYLPVLILGFFPWIAFFPSSLSYAFTRLRASQSDERERRIGQMVRLAIAWTALPLFFFSFAETKLPNYVALEMPALAVLTALYFDQAVGRARSRSALVSTAAVPIVIVLLGIAIVLFSRDNRLTGSLTQLAVNLVYVGGAVFVGSIAAFVAFTGSPRMRQAAPGILCASMIVAVAFIALLALPLTERFKPVPHLAQIIREHRLPNDAVAIMNVAGGNALIFYTRPHVYVLKTAAGARRVICSAPRTWLIGPHGGQTPDPAGAPKRITQWGKDDLYLYSRGSCTSRRVTRRRPYFLSAVTSDGLTAPALFGPSALRM